MDLHKLGVMVGFVMILWGTAFRHRTLPFLGGLVQFVSVWSEWL